MIKSVVFVIVFIVVAGITGVGTLIIVPYEGTWLQRQWNKARYPSQCDVERSV